MLFLVADTPDAKGKAKGHPETDEDTKNGGAAAGGPMALGEISFIDSKITSTKIEGLQPLYSVSWRAIVYIVAAHRS